MAKRARLHNILNHRRQVSYLDKGIVMLPSKSEESRTKKKKK